MHLESFVLVFINAIFVNLPVSLGSVLAVHLLSALGITHHLFANLWIFILIAALISYILLLILISLPF